MIWRIAPLAGMVLLAGCGWVGRDGLETEVARVGDGLVFANLEAFTVINTHKTMGDHVASWVTGLDCSTPRASRGDSYCRDRPPKPQPPQQVYCYASLGRPSCFSQPYNEGNDRLIGFIPASTPVR